MQINTIKPKTARKKKIRIGRGGKRGTYSTRGIKGQKSRSGASINPLFEGGRSTLIDHMKKKRGFTSPRPKKAAVKFSDLSKKFKNDAKITMEGLVRNNLIKKADVSRGVKVLGPKDGKKEFSFDKNILLSKSVK